MPANDHVQKSKIMMKTYVGDSVYAEWNGHEIILTTENGYIDDPRNRIVIERDSWERLVAKILRQTSVTRLHADTVCPWDECPAFEKRAGGEPDNNSPCLSMEEGE